MSEVVNIPQLRFPEFNGGWKESRIGKIYKDLRTGSTPSRAVKSYFKGDNPWITSGELKYNRISTTFEQISDEAIKDTNLVLYQPGTLFIAITGLEAPGTRGKCAINAVPSTTNQSCLAFRKVDSVDTIYMFYWYLKYGKPLYFKYAQGTKQQSFNNKIVEKFQIFLPNKPEQQKIAAFLSAVDNKIEQLSKKQELLGEYKKGLMQQIFSQAIRFKADDGSDFPDWEEVKLGNIGEFKTSSVDKKIVEGQKLIQLVNYMNVYKHENIKNNSTKDLMIVSANETQLNASDLKKGDILFTPSSETPDDIGHSVVIFEDLMDTLYSYHLMRFRPKVQLDILYSHYFCNIPDVLRQISRVATGSTRFTISVGEFSKIQINLPSLLEQTKIANFLSAIDNKIEKVGKQLVESKQFKKALLQQMFV
jgi:type I restriction enzyme S subunit